MKHTPPHPPGTPENWQFCPDCEAERPGSGWQEPTAFYPGLKARCKRHHAKKSNDRRKEVLEALKVTEPTMYQQKLERKREVDRLVQRKRRADPKRRPKVMAAVAKYRNKPEIKQQIAAYYEEWRVKNPDKRKTSQEAWRERQRLRRKTYESRAGLVNKRRTNDNT